MPDTIEAVPAAIRIDCGGPKICTSARTIIGVDGVAETVSVQSSVVPFKTEPARKRRHQTASLGEGCSSNNPVVLAECVEPGSCELGDGESELMSADSTDSTVGTPNV